MPDEPAGQPGDDPEAMRAALAIRIPTTSEELWHFCKYVMQLSCEPCGGTGSFVGLAGRETCLWCRGLGRMGFHFGRVAICPGHVAPFDIFRDLLWGQLQHVLIIGSRGGGKTMMLALVEFLKMWFQRFTVAHMGAVENQANRARDHFHRIVGEPPWSDQLGGLPPGMEGLRFSDGGKIEWLPGTLKQASGPHPELSVLDEVDEAAWDVRQRFLKTPFGPRAQFIEASTHYIQLGTVTRIEKEQAHLPTRKFCLWETLSRCEYDCDRMPLPDGTVGRCPLWETEEIQTDGSMRMVTLCGGVLARRCDGFRPVPDAVAAWLRADIHTRRIEFLCEKPGMAIGSKAYWAYSDLIGQEGNVLPWNPEVRPDTPIEWTMDFNPGVGMRMCSLIVQQAPPQFGPEWWVLDEIVLLTSSTEETVREFIRRFGAGGFRLTEDARETGHMGGLWVFGDATGHARTSVTGETDYDAIVRMLRNTHGFRLMVPYGTANPPLVDRLNMTNRMLCDIQGGGGRRSLKFAPRCVEARREMDLMPIGPDRQKDKSVRVQKQLGLSHLGDALECWVAARFPNGPLQLSIGQQVLLGGQRTSTELGAALGGRRLSVGGTGASPWATGKDQEESSWK